MDSRILEIVVSAVDVCSTVDFPGVSRTVWSRWKSDHLFVSLVHDDAATCVTKYSAIDPPLQLSILCNHMCWCYELRR